MIHSAAATAAAATLCGSSFVACCSCDDDVMVHVPSTPASLAVASVNAVSKEEPVEDNKEVPEGRRRAKRSVTFGSVHVRNHRVTLGDHPCCDLIGGYPLSLDWAHGDAEEYSLDWYEKTKPKGRCPRLSKEGRIEVIEEIAGIDRSELEFMEEQRLLELLEEDYQQQQQDSDDEAEDEEALHEDEEEHGAEDEEALHEDEEEHGAEEVHESQDDDDSVDDSSADEHDQDQDPASVELQRSVRFGNVQVQEYSVTLGDHPLCDSYPLTLDWQHTEAMEYELDWYEETKRNGAWYVPTGRSRMLQLETVTGVDRSVWRWREGRRLQKATQQKLLELVVEMEQQEQKRARKEERAAARALQPVRRTPRLAKKDSTPIVVVRRSARLAAKLRCP
jgi:hypothetical protein